MQQLGDVAYSELALKALRLLIGRQVHRPIFRWRFARHSGDAEPWRLAAPATEAEIVRLWNYRGTIEVELMTVETLQDMLLEAYEAGARYEKFGRPADQFFARLGYRRCLRRRSDSGEGRPAKRRKAASLPQR